MSTNAMLAAQQTLGPLRYFLCQSRLDPLECREQRLIGLEVREWFAGAFSPLLGCDSAVCESCELQPAFLRREMGGMGSKGYMYQPNKDIFTLSYIAISN